MERKRSANNGRRNDDGFRKSLFCNYQYSHSDKDQQCILKSLQVYWGTGYFHDLKISPHKTSINQKKKKREKLGRRVERSGRNCFNQVIELSITDTGPPQLIYRSQNIKLESNHEERDKSILWVLLKKKEED